MEKSMSHAEIQDMRQEQTERRMRESAAVQHYICAEKQRLLDSTEQERRAVIAAKTSFSAGAYIQKLEKFKKKGADSKHGENCCAVLHRKHTYDQEFRKQLTAEVQSKNA